MSDSQNHVTPLDLRIALTLAQRAVWLLVHPCPLFSDSTAGERHAANEHLDGDLDADGFLLGAV